MHFATNLLSKSNPNDNPDLNPYKSLLSNPLFTASYLCPDLLAIILESFHDWQPISWVLGSIIVQQNPQNQHT